MPIKKQTYYSQKLINDISLYQTISTTETKKAIQVLIKILIKHILKGKIIKIVRFGKFLNTKRNEKQTTHPITKKNYTILKRKTIQCKFSNTLTKHSRDN